MVSYKGRVLTLEKFSSMGNGFTFELETLIFKSLIRGIALYCGLEDDSSCYGDDIICNPQLGLAIQFYFPAFGFKTNREKTFLTGNFRESCGGDYRLGCDVRPFFLRGARSMGRITFAKLVSFHNFLQRKPWFDPSKQIRSYLLTMIPERTRRWGPDGYGDIWLLSLAPCSSYLPRLSTLRGKQGYEGFIAQGFVAVPHRDERDCLGDTLIPAYFAGRGPQFDIHVVRPKRGARLKARLRTVIVDDHGSQLDDFPEGGDPELASHLL
jgi:hypothetical protein